MIKSTNKQLKPRANAKTNNNDVRAITGHVSRQPAHMVAHFVRTRSDWQNSK
jgi:hypothetical protein